MMLLSFLFACDLLGPPDVSEELGSAKAALQQGDIAKAKGEYRNALTVDSKNIDALLGHAYVLLLEKEFSKADSVLTEAQVAAKESERNQIIKEINV